MTTDTQDTGREKPVRTGRNETLSKDGKWRSFNRVPNLLQYVSTGLFYARVKVSGKLIRRALKSPRGETPRTFEEAKLLLHDFLAKEKGQDKPAAPHTVGVALRHYLRSLQLNSHLSPATLKYYRDCTRTLLQSWPGLRTVQLHKLAMVPAMGDAYLKDPAYKQVQEWANKLAGEIHAQYFNNVLRVLRIVLELGGIARDRNPAFKVKRKGIKLAPPKLPEPQQFISILNHMETSGAGQQQACADFARFLAFSGCRLSEARRAVWGDVDASRGLLTVHSAKVRKDSSKAETRLVPIIPDMRQLLERLRQQQPRPEDRICTVGECEKSLRRACKLVGVSALTHHDLRHLFATRCIEAGVDIPTVARWLGHSDGGALAMRVYGHLREKHSAEMAARVTFGTNAAETEGAK